MQEVQNDIEGITFLVSSIEANMSYDIYESKEFSLFYGQFQIAKDFLEAICLKLPSRLYIIMMFALMAKEYNHSYKQAAIKIQARLSQDHIFFGSRVNQIGKLQLGDSQVLGHNLVLIRKYYKGNISNTTKLMKQLRSEEIYREEIHYNILNLDLVVSQ